MRNSRVAYKLDLRIKRLNEQFKKIQSEQATYDRQVQEVLGFAEELNSVEDLATIHNALRDADAQKRVRVLIDVLKEKEVQEIVERSGGKQHD